MVNDTPAGTATEHVTTCTLAATQVSSPVNAPQ